MSENKYGEPWMPCCHTEHIRCAGEHNRYGEMPYGFDVYVGTNKVEWPEIRNRIIACINALAGIDDVQGFVDAVRELMKKYGPDSLLGRSEDFVKIRAMMEGK